MKRARPELAPDDDFARVVDEARMAARSLAEQYQVMTQELRAHRARWRATRGVLDTKLVLTKDHLRKERR